jgi:hypothetical protein
MNVYVATGRPRIPIFIPGIQRLTPDCVTDAALGAYRRRRQRRRHLSDVAAAFVDLLAEGEAVGD